MLTVPAPASEIYNPAWWLETHPPARGTLASLSPLVVHDHATKPQGSRKFLQNILVGGSFSSDVTGLKKKLERWGGLTDPHLSRLRLRVTVGWIGRRRGVPHTLPGWGHVARLRGGHVAGLSNIS